MLRSAIGMLLLWAGVVASAGRLSGVQVLQQPGQSLPSERAHFTSNRQLHQVENISSVPNAAVGTVAAPLPAVGNASVNSSRPQLSNPAVALIAVNAAGLEAKNSLLSQADTGDAILPGSLPAAGVNSSAAFLTQPVTGLPQGVNRTQPVSKDNDTQLLTAASSTQRTAVQQNTTGLLIAAAGAANTWSPVHSTNTAIGSIAPAVNTSAKQPLQSVRHSSLSPDTSMPANTTALSRVAPTNSTARAAPGSTQELLPGAADRHIVCHCTHDDSHPGTDDCDKCTGTSVKEMGEVEVTIVHFNDWHVRVEPTKEAYCALCSSYEVEQGRCNGGLARMTTFVKQQRMRDPQLLLLNAGDDFIGTEWDRKAGVEAPAAFMNLLGVDVSTVGNHEWDKGLDTLKQYVDKLDSHDVLGANIDFKGHALKDKIKPYVVKYVKGKKICILGLTTQYGLPSDKMGSVYIKEPYSYGRDVLKGMDGEGCHATILLSHLGYTADIVAVKVLPGLDVVIGGHSHSFLWPDPNNPPAFFKYNGDYKHDSTWGTYPTMVHTEDREVPVVTASWGSRYMGKLTLTFESENTGGRVKQVDSEIFLLGGPNSDTHVEQDQEALDMIKKWRTF